MTRVSTSSVEFSAYSGRPMKNWRVTAMTDNEKLIEDAAKAIHEVIPGSGAYASWVEAREQGFDMLGDMARAAFAVFEKAHAPTDNEREALAVLISEYINETDDCGDLPKTRGLAEQIIAGFRRQEPQAEPTDAQVIAAVDAFMASQSESEDGSTLVHKNMAAALRAAAETRGENR